MEFLPSSVSFEFPQPGSVEDPLFPFLLPFPPPFYPLLLVLALTLLNLSNS